MVRCGLRVDEIAYPTLDRLRWSSSGDCWLLEVPRQEHEGERKEGPRWIPKEVAENMQRCSSERGRDAAESIVSVTTQSVRRWVKEAAEQLADDGNGDRWRSVFSHDLRRSWATYHLVERGVNVRTMMSIGGWSDYSAMEPYLGEATENKIGQSMAD